MATDPRLARPLWRGRTNVDALTIACIEHAEQISGHEFTVTQGSYQAGNGDENSAGTHDLGGAVDLGWCGHNNCVRALRLAGMAAWHRTPAQGPWPHHIHAVVLDHPFRSLAARAQCVAYLNRRDGLASNGPDDGPQLNPIPRPVWPWPQEEDMPAPKDWDAEDWAALGAHLDEFAKRAGDLIKITNPKDPAKPKWSLSTALGSLYKRTAPKKETP